MYGDFGKAIEGLFYFVIGTTVVAFFLGVYVLVSMIFVSSDWDICSKMSTDAEKVQCMEIHND